MDPQNVVKRTDMFLVPANKIQIEEGFNLPGRDDHITELGESLYHNGPKVPLKGYKEGDHYVVVAGHRRVKAAEYVKKVYKKIIIFPFMVYPRGISKAELLLEHFLTNDAEELTPLQKAYGVQKLLDEKMKIKEIAQHLAVTEVYVGNLKKLAEAPEPAKDLVRNGIVSSTLLIQELKRKGDITDFIIRAGKKASGKAEVSHEQVTEERIERKKKKAATGKKTKTKGSKAPGAAKSKTAKVTKKDIEQNSVKELKRFIKLTRDDMPFIMADKEIVYQFCKNLVDNKFTYDGLLKYFTDTK